MQTEKRAGRVMRSVAAVLVIILAIVALFQGFRMRGKEALFRNVAVETENLPEEKQSGDDRAKIACEQGKEVTYQGEKYVYNEDLVSILFLGVDKEAFEEGGTVGWESYKKTGKVCGIELPEGLKESDKLPEPIYTPSTKAEIGDHDENISFEQSVEHLEKYYPGKGKEYAEKLRDYTITLYKKCAAYALEKGIIIADTKFEFGLDENGNITIGDEMLTPDSSRFWPAEGYEPGHGQPSFDKQFARDWLKENPDNDWTLPQEIVDKTIEKYLQGYEMLTGKKLD